MVDVAVLLVVGRWVGEGVVVVAVVMEVVIIVELGMKAHLNI